MSILLDSVIDQSTNIMNNNVQDLQGRIDFAMRLIDGYLNDDSVACQCKNKLLMIEGALVDKSIDVNDIKDTHARQIIEERERINKLLKEKLETIDECITVSEIDALIK